MISDSRARKPGNGPQSLILLILVAGALAFLVVRLVDVLLLIFASILMAMLLHAIARPLRKRARLGRTAALIAALAVLFSFVGLVGWFFGSQISVQLSNLWVLVPRSWQALEAKLSASALGVTVLDQLRHANLPNAQAVDWVTRTARDAAAAVAGTVIIVAAGSYLAFHPETYAQGLLLLVPRSHRPRAAEIMEACRVALTQWLVGQLVSMIFISVTTSIGLWLAGVPSPLALGLLAGLGHMVPVVGPLATAVPAALIALAQSPETFGWTVLLYVVTGQFESSLLTPLVMRQMAQLPMALTLFAVIAMGVLLGPLGVLFATPLAVVAYVMVRMIYLEDVLGERLAPPSSSA
jgi:predicted PurR-regulated permease PerM